MQLEVQQNIYQNADIKKLMELASKRKEAISNNLNVVEELEKLLSNPSALDAQMKTIAVRRLMAANHVKAIHIAIDKAADKGEDHLTYSVHRTHPDETAQETIQSEIREYITQSLMQSFYGIEWIANHKIEVHWGIKPTKVKKKTDWKPVSSNHLLYTSIVALLISIFTYILPFKPLAIGSLVTSAVTLLGYSILNRSLLYSNTDSIEETNVQWFVIIGSWFTLLLLTSIGLFSLPAVLYSIVIVVALQLLCTRNRAMNNCITIGSLLFASLAVYKTDKLRVDLPFQSSKTEGAEDSSQRDTDTSDADAEAKKVISLLDNLDIRGLVLSYIIKQSNYEFIKKRLRYSDYLVDIKQDNIFYGVNYTYVSIVHKRSSTWDPPSISTIQNAILLVKPVILPVNGRATMFNSITIEHSPSIVKDVIKVANPENYFDGKVVKLNITNTEPILDPSDRRYTYQVEYPEKLELMQRTFDLTQDLQPTVNCKEQPNNVRCPG